MNIHGCSVCRTRTGGKLASVYAAWFRADGERTAWKQRLCVQCLTHELAQLLRSAAQNSEDLSVCPACGMDSSETMDPLYLTVYVPKQEAREYALPTCTSCAATLRVSLQQGAEKLTDRQRANGAASTSSTSDPWNEVLP
jgi:hypothetical protein